MTNDVNKSKIKFHYRIFKEYKTDFIMQPSCMDFRPDPFIINPVFILYACCFDCYWFEISINE